VWQNYSMGSRVLSLRGRNVLGTQLLPCCHNTKTGFFRDGFCRTSELDAGSHTVCAIVTKEFLEYSAQQGNDLTAPRLEFGFAGLKPGDKWCLCGSRWAEALAAGKAPPVILEATHEAVLEHVTLRQLKAFQYRPPRARPLKTENAPSPAE